MEEFAALADDDLGHAVGDHDAADRLIARGQALGDGHQVGLEVVILRSEPGAEAAESGDDLVDDQQDAALGADALDLRPIAVRRDDYAAGALDGFGDEGGDVALADFVDLALERLRGLAAELGRIHVGCAAEVVGLFDVLDAGDREVALGMHGLHAAQAGAGHGAAVIGVIARNDHLLVGLAQQLPVVAHHAQHGVVGVRAGAGEEHVVHVRRRDFGQQLRQLDGRRVAALEEVVVVGQFLHLPVGGFRQFLAAVADVDAPQAGHAVQDLVAVGVPQIAAFRARDDARALGVEFAVVGERMQMVGGVEALPVGSGALCLTHNDSSRWRFVRLQTDSSRNSRSQELMTRKKVSYSLRLIAA